MQEYKIVVQGTRKIITYLKRYLKIPYKLYYFAKQNEYYFKKLKNADVVITMSWGKTMWGGTENLKVPEVQNLKLIHLPGAGTDAINFSQLPKNCNVCNVYEHEIPIAEYCLANILNWEMNLIEKISKFKNLDWSDCMIFDGPTHSELYDKTIGILGYGKIGKEIAKRIKDLGLENDLINHKGLTPGMLVTLGEQKILTLNDFADLASDELTGGYDVVKGERVRIKGYLEDFALSKKEADDLIMSARDIVYKD